MSASSRTEGDKQERQTETSPTSLTNRVSRPAFVLECVPPVRDRTRFASIPLIAKNETISYTRRRSKNSSLFCTKQNGRKQQNICHGATSSASLTLNSSQWDVSRKNQEERKKKKPFSVPSTFFILFFLPFPQASTSLRVILLLFFFFFFNSTFLHPRKVCVLLLVIAWGDKWRIKSARGVRYRTALTHL